MAHFANIVHAVAVDAVRDTVVAGGQPLAVHARAVLRQLVDPLLRLVAVNHLRVTMAPRAHGGRVLPADLASKAFGRAHRDFRIGTRRVAAVTAGAGEPALAVNVVRKGLGGLRQRAVQQRVAFQAGVL
jgi:hypothetical protein